MTSNDTAVRLRILDYVANSGGGVRFLVELVRALSLNYGLSLELVSHGQALDDYRLLLSQQTEVRLLDIPPANLRWIRGAHGFRGASRINTHLGLPQFHFEVPIRACRDCEVLWLPWLHRHRLPRDANVDAVGSLHDVIMLQFPGLVSRRRRRDEYETVRRWIGSRSRIAVSSYATARSLGQLFPCEPDRVRVIPVSGQHVRPARALSRKAWPFDNRPYLLCPANTMPHKNHEVLFAGLREAAQTHPVVLTGGGTDFWGLHSARADQLRRSARDAGLAWGDSLFGLGHVSDSDYYELLDGAWALVMPTLAEGGGSFPVLEAMAAGVPVLVSDIPVIREMLERTGGSVYWFDPTDTASLAGAIAELRLEYPAVKRTAVSQAGGVRQRSWDDVAADYAELLGIASLSNPG
jgi:glycosyltransferase involved in cell wall biosynthesis